MSGGEYSLPLITDLLTTLKINKKNTSVGMTPDQGDMPTTPEGCVHLFLIFSCMRWFILSQDDDQTSRDPDNTRLKTRF